MPYECKLCHKVTSTPQDLAKHFMSMADAKHIEYMESKGISFVEIVKKGNYTALAEMLKSDAYVDG